YETEAGKQALSVNMSGDPFNEVLREETRLRVRAVLAELKPEQAKILILRSSGLSYKETAEALGVGVGSIGTLLARAEAEFEKRYSEIYESKVECRQSKAL